MLRCSACFPHCGSIFAPRRKEAESRSLFDKDRTVKKAFDADYGRMLKEGRVFRLIAKADAAVGRGEKTVEDSLNEASRCRESGRRGCQLAQARHHNTVLKYAATGRMLESVTALLHARLDYLIFICSGVNSNGGNQP